MSDIFLAKSPFVIIKSPRSVGESPAKTHSCAAARWRSRGLAPQSPPGQLRNCEKGACNEQKIGVYSCSSLDLSSKGFCMNVLGLCSSGGSKQTEKKKKQGKWRSGNQRMPTKIIQHGPLQPAFIHLTIWPGGDLNPTLESKKSIAVNCQLKKLFSRNGLTSYRNAVYCNVT